MGLVYSCFYNEQVGGCEVVHRTKMHGKTITSCFVTHVYKMIVDYWITVSFASDFVSFYAQTCYTESLS